MSQTQIRAPKIEPPLKHKPLVAALLIVGMAAIVVVCLLVLSPHFVGDSKETAGGTILQTRIDKIGNFEGGLGGYIAYRIEARVQYSVHGSSRDRWLPASYGTADRASLQMQLLKEPKTCLVVWTPRHEENARCMLN
ncbi:MAG TPA: hypothetical protein VGJ21_17280 [Terracidiphilus sp.]|jgi:hypothetical protein